ncbi:MAG: family 20 glycosylhydrolase [Flavobacteriaceae bacterium]|nr:family 20 glycosylhydrolase [Candidatus Onthonaster equi]
MNYLKNTLKTLIYSLFLFNFNTANAQFDSIEINKLTTQFKDLISVNQNQILLPKIDGYTIKLIGSDNKSTIDLNGNIHRPLIHKKVNLLFKATRNSDSSEAEIPVKNILVTGKYTDQGQNQKPFVIPSLREWHGELGEFKLNSRSRIIINSSNPNFSEAAYLLKEDLKKQFGYNVEVVINKKPKKGDIIIENSIANELGDEGYTIKIKDYAQLEAPAYSGIVFATRTILQILDQSTDKMSLPKGEIRDYPTYEVRAMMLDVGRKFFTIDFLNDYVEILSYYKISNFQIHLNDNAFDKYFEFDWDKTPSGFRLQNDTYPDLASKDGHYTKKQFIDLQKKALRYGIKIIPEIDVPAHSLAITKIFPEIASDKYGKDHLDLNHPKTYEVVKNIFDEYTQGENPVFIGEEVHIGTDEYDKKEAETFRKFTDFLIQIVQNNGKKVRAWGALTHANGDTPVTSKDVTLNMWYNGYADPIEMKKLGYKQISTPDGWLYIVPAAGYYYDYLNVNNIYNKWEPRHIGNISFEKGDPTIVGGMFAIWNDIAGNGISEKDVHNRSFPALQVLAEKMWNSEEQSLSLFDFNQKKLSVTEAPGLNLRGYYGESIQKLMDYHFENNFINSVSNNNSGITYENIAFVNGISGQGITSNNQGKITFPFEEIGNSYTVSFWAKPVHPNASLNFKSKHAIFYINPNGIGYSREGYDYELSENTLLSNWHMITIIGNKEQTSLFINGQLIKKMETEKIVLPYKDKTDKEITYNKVKTLTFPLRDLMMNNYIIDEFKVYNIEFSKDEILSEYNLYK